MCGISFRSNRDINRMLVILRKKMPEIKWNLGDSEYEPNFYIRGKTPENIKIKITEESTQEFYLGIYLYMLNNDIEEAEKQKLRMKYLNQILTTLNIKS